jgi:hypothetical protein
MPLASSLYVFSACFWVTERMMSASSFSWRSCSVSGGACAGHKGHAAATHGETRA